jgi:uncharacterized protein involved in exopolysaccharide biosynthesis
LQDARAEGIRRLEREMARRRERLEAEIQDLRRDFASDEEDLAAQLRQRQAEARQVRTDAEEMAASRHVEAPAGDTLDQGGRR